MGAGPRHLILERNDKFFLAGRPHLDRIIFEYISDPAARVAAIETGAIHVMPYSYVGLGNIKRVEALPHLAVTTCGYEAIGPLTWIEINLRKKELSDVRVRQAIAHVLDKELIVEDIPCSAASSSGRGPRCWSAWPPAPSSSSSASAWGPPPATGAGAWTRRSCA